MVRDNDKNRCSSVTPRAAAIFFSTVKDGILLHVFAKIMSISTWGAIHITSSFLFRTPPFLRWKKLLCTQRTKATNICNGSTLPNRYTYILQLNPSLPEMMINPVLCQPI